MQGFILGDKVDMHIISSLMAAGSTCLGALFFTVQGQGWIADHCLCRACVMYRARPAHDAYRWSFTLHALRWRERLGAFLNCLLATAVAFLGMVAFPSVVHAENVADYPSRSLTILVGFPPGGASDAAARILADRLRTKWPKTTIIVENRGGANGSIAAAALAKSIPDGYTIFLVTSSHVNLKYLYSSLSFDPDKDFQPVTQLLSMPNVFTVGPSILAKNYAELASEIQAKPNTFTAWSTGNGSDPHLALALFEDKTGLKLRHVPYKGGGPGLVDMLGGRVDITLASLGTVLNQINTGKLRALAAGGDKRDPQLPTVPTYAELGIKDFSPQTWYGIMVPAGTPMPIVQKLNQTINEVMNTPEGIAKLAVLGAQPANTSIADFSRIISRDSDQNGKLIKELNIKID